MTSAKLLDRILSRIGEAQARCPELRFGQLIATIGSLAEDEGGHCLWEVEDEEFAAALDRFVADVAQRHSVD